MSSGYAFKSSDYEDQGIQLIKIGNLYQNKLDLRRSPTYLQDKFLESHPDYVVKHGDLLMSLTGTLGKRDYGFTCRYIEHKPSLLNQRVGKLDLTSEEISDDFMEFYLTSEIYLSQLFQKPTGTKQGNLSNDDVLSNYVWLPNIEEQEEICQYIKKMVNVMDLSLKKLLKKINLLNEYRQSIISSVVTGKVRVTEDMI
jgi:type I restriction enzyme S subunit